MDMVPVSSFIIASVGYEDGEMIIEFRLGGGGGRYKYSNVPASVYDGLISASSMGNYFKKYIAGKYKESKIPSSSNFEVKI